MIFFHSFHSIENRSRGTRFPEEKAYGKAKRGNRRVTPQERHFLVLEAANWPYCDNYERKLFPCIERGRTIASIRSNPRPWAKFRDQAYVIRLILSNLIRKRTKSNDSLSLFLLSWPAIKFPLIRLSYSSYLIIITSCLIIISSIRGRHFPRQFTRLYTCQSLSFVFVLLLYDIYIFWIQNLFICVSFFQEILRTNFSKVYTHILEMEF